MGIREDLFPKRVVGDWDGAVVEPPALGAFQGGGDVALRDVAR